MKPELAEPGTGRNRIDSRNWWNRNRRNWEPEELDFLGYTLGPKHSFFAPSRRNYKWTPPLGVVFHGDSESAIERSGEGRGGSVLTILHFGIFGGLGPLEPDFLELEPAEPTPETELAELDFWVKKSDFWDQKSDFWLSFIPKFCFRYTLSF